MLRYVYVLLARCYYHSCNSQFPCKSGYDAVPDKMKIKINVTKCGEVYLFRHQREISASLLFFFVSFFRISEKSLIRYADCA